MNGDDTTKIQSDTAVDGKAELKAFDALFPEILQVLTESGLKDPEISQAMAWFKTVLEYNVPFGKKNRGLSVASSFRRLVKDVTTEDLKIAYILGWCVEMLQAFFIVADDIMDNSITRRGQPCWYKKENVGVIAINDSFYLESCVYQLLRKYIRGKPYYMDIVDLFLETTWQTVTGQCMDLTTSPPGTEVDFTLFTLTQHAYIVTWKTAFYSFYLPVAVAMHLAGISDEESHKQAKSILLEMGHFYQVQDDYLDCYGTPEVIGKIGTDIEENKCSWLIVTALDRASEEQKQILKENYARWDKTCVQKVKDIYQDLNIEDAYKKYEESSYQDLMSRINNLSDRLPKSVFTDFAKRIYKRDK